MESKFYYFKRTFDALNNAGTPDRERSLAGWQRRAAITRSALMEIKRQHKDEVAALAKTFQPKALEERRQPLDDAFSEVTKIAKERAMQDLDEVLDGKRKQFDRANDAPSEEHLRLLNALSLRSTLTADEVAAVAAKFDGNRQSLLVLRDLAAKHNLTFPRILTAGEIEAAIKEARDFAERMIESMEKDDRDLTYSELAFYTYPDHRGPSTAYFEPLDASQFTAEQIKKQTAEEAEPAKAAISEGRKPNAVKVYLRGDETAAGIAMQFGISTRDLARANPEKDLSRLNYNDSLIVPAGTLHVTDAPGSIVPGQCVPTYYEPHEAEAVKAGENVTIV